MENQLQSTLSKTKNYFRCVGTVNELALKREPCKIKVWEDGKEVGAVDGERIMGNVSVKTDNGIHTFWVFNSIRNNAEKYLASLKDEAQIKSFKRQMSHFHMFEEMMNWTPAIGKGAGPEPTLVNIEGTVAINDYVNQQGEISTGLRWNVSSGSTKASPDAVKGTTLNATLYIDHIDAEVRNEEETGRLKVTLYGVDRHGACFPVNAIVPESIKVDGEELQLAEVFEEMYEVGQTANFDIDIVAQHIGSASKKRTFGKGGSVEVNSGFDITELHILGAEDPIPEPEELTYEDENGNIKEVKTEWINPETMKLAKNERQRMLEELKSKGADNKRKNISTASSLSAKKQQARKMPTSNSNVPPFDTDDDELFDLF